MLESEQLVNIDGEQIDTTIIDVEWQKGTAMFIHGGGRAAKERYLPMARSLATRGYRCLLFSYPGHGNSPGTIEGSSLKKRTDIAYHLATQLGFMPGTLVCGFSMGAHTAVSLLENNPDAFERVALFVPAAYAHKAETAVFADGFTEIIREEESYRSSKLWEILSTYRGKLLTVEGGKDDVIPAGVVDLLYQSSPLTSAKLRVCLSESPHGIAKWLSESPQRIDPIAKLLDTYDSESVKNIL